MQITFYETRLFLENLSLEFNKIWHGNALENRQLEYSTLAKEILDIPLNLQQVPSVKLFFK